MIPKPRDWSGEINISGFFFHSQPSYQPTFELSDFLNSGPRPIYIGFGSIIVSDPEHLTQILTQAVSRLNIRAVVSKGWCGLTAESPSKDIYFLDNVPHDWLFPQVKAVVHHGGAGTTAIGLKCGKPTVVISFFGDQKFWGDMVYRAGVGPQPIPYKELTVEKLVDAIRVAISDNVAQAAKDVAARIEGEDGVQNAINGFYRLLPLKSMRCAIIPDKVAVWTVPGSNVGISSIAAGVLDSERKLDLKKLKLKRHKLFDTENQQVVPFSLCD